MRLRFALPCLLVTTTACVGEPVTAGGRASADLYDVFMAVAAVVFVVVASLIGWSIVRYRRKDADETLPKQFRDNVKLEILWFAIPQLLVIGLFAGSVVALNDVDEESGDPTVTIGVDAFQWGWRFTYETTDVVVDSLPDDPAEIVIPVGETVSFSLTSSDVIHSFYVPAFFQKRDVVPGLTNRMDVVVEEAGSYDAKCAEFCGLLHDRMDFTIRAAPRAEYEAWLARSEAVDD
ncbi:MAG TPA: cytochrome c oxidase subunit II [Actinomycetota bacterium]|nr:cytochrome c oxidase subunit II [Actinomycetota bacterium]